MKRIFFLIIILALLGSGCVRQPIHIDIPVNAKTAVIMDAKRGRVIFGKNPDEKFPPASTAKVMTAIIAIEHMSLDAEITPTKNVYKVEPTIAGLKPGVKYKLRDLIAAILIKSANDAAFTIAESVAGSEKKFAELMNYKAKRLGMEDTYFATASGLPTGKKDSQYTTARDLAKMMQYALRYQTILEFMSFKEMDIYGSDKKRIYLKTHNKSLLRSNSAPWGKTGYTKEARRTFVGVNPSAKPVIVFALLKSTDLWNDIAALNRQGILIYQMRNRNFLKDLIDWIKSSREEGREFVLENRS